MVEPTLCAGRMHPTDVGSMFSTYEQVYTYILKMACKVHLPEVIFLLATELGSLFNSENVADILVCEVCTLKRYHY